MVQDESATTTGPSEAAEPQPQRRTRAQTKIEFPYADLPATVELAAAIHSHAGSSAEDQEVAAWLDESAEGGTFRSRRSSARMFGLIEVAQGRLTLTALGRQIVNDAESRVARVEAFLKPELFATMYEQFKGQALPPPPAIERHMEQQLGVPPKQKTRARQVFQKSAQYAGFIDATSGRFVKPGIGGDADRRKSEDSKPTGRENDRNSGTDGGGGGDQTGIDPIIRGLLARLPKSGTVWPDAERKLWLAILENSFKLIYKDAQQAGSASEQE